MSSPNAVVYMSPAYNILTILLSRAPYQADGYAYLDCYETPVAMNVTKFSWDGTQLFVSGVFNSLCTGTFYEFVFRLSAMGRRIGGIGDIADLNIQVEKDAPYLIYLVETLTQPTTATVYIT